MTKKFTRRQASLMLGGVALGATFAAPAIVRAAADRTKKFDGTTLNMLAVQFDFHNSLWKQIPEFEAATGIKVNIEFAPFENAREKTLLDMSSRTGRFDLFTVDIMWLAEYAAAGYLEPVAKYIANPDLTAEDYDVNDFVSRVYSGTGVYGDVMYNVPYGCGTAGNMFRADLIEKAGITVPKRFDGTFTTDKFMEITHALNDPGKGMAGYVTGPQRWGWGWMFTPLLYAFQDPKSTGNEFVDKDWKVNIANDKNLDALKWYLGLRDVTPKDDLNFGYGEQLAVYQQGKAGGSITYSGFIGSHYEDPSLEIKGRNVALHTPVGPSGRTDPFFGAWGLSISSDSKSKEAAWLLIQWLTAKKQLTKAAIGGLSGVRHSTFQNKEFQTSQPWAAELYEYVKSIANPDERIRVPEWAEISEVLGLYGNKAWGNEMSAEQALEAMDAGMTKAFKRGGYYRDGAKNPTQHWRDLSYYDRKPSEWA